MQVVHICWKVCMGDFYGKVNHRALRGCKTRPCPLMCTSTKTPVTIDNMQTLLQRTPFC